MKVTIIGTGYVGLSTGVCLAYLGHNVACVDTDQEKIDRLKKGIPPIFEPHLEDLLADASPRLTFTTSYAAAVPGSDVVFLAVGTPPGPNGAPDLQYLRAAASTLGSHLGDQFTVIVNKSTVPVGSGNWVDSIVRDACPDGHFCIASNPEFLREGSALHDSLYPDRVVVGADEPAGIDVLSALYRPVLDQSFAPPTYLPRPSDIGAVPLVTTDRASAELIKYAANAFLSLKISFINEIGALAGKVGANVQSVARGIGLDRRIGSRFLSAGIGWGGSCFGKDTSALIASAEEYGLSMAIVKAARDVNYRQREVVVERLLGSLKILKGRTIGLLGVAFKPDTDDLRDAPALDIAKRLVSRGARVRLHDPIAAANARQALGDNQEALVCDTVDQVAQGTDALVLVTEWKEYRQLDWTAIRPVVRHPLILDGRNVLDRQEVESAGFQYLSLQ
jgi:UDPglucose 6-dehydrogenase